MTLQRLLLLVLIVCTVSKYNYAQVTAISYKVDFNQNTKLYDCKIVVTEGNTTSQPISRIQANAQYSLVVPTGSVVEIASLNMPLVGNNNYQGTEPMEWVISNVLESPEAQSQSDYYGILPRLSPAAYYNDLHEGDEITLFSLNIDSPAACERNIRPFNSATDPSSVEPGMLGADFRNGITIGSPIQLYVGNIEPSITMAAAMVDHTICPGECTKLSSAIECMAYPMRYSWDTGEITEEITVCPTESTVYQVTITDGNGSTTVTNTEVTVDTSAESGCITSAGILAGESISLYPNPTHGLLSIGTQPEILEVKVYTIDGQLLTTTLGTDQTVDMSHLPTGAYFVEVLTSQSHSINKILKL